MNILYSLTTNPDQSCKLTVFDTKSTASVSLTKDMAIQLANKLNPNGQKPLIPERFAPEMVLDCLEETTI